MKGYETMSNLSNSLNVTRRSVNLLRNLTGQVRRNISS